MVAKVDAKALKVSMKCMYDSTMLMLAGHDGEDAVDVLSSDATPDGFRLDSCKLGDGKWSKLAQRAALTFIMPSIGIRLGTLDNTKLAALSYASLKLMDEGFEPELVADACAELEDEMRSEEGPKPDSAPEPDKDELMKPVTVTLKKIEFEVLHDAAMLGAHRMIDNTFDDFAGKRKVGIAAKVVLDKLRKALGEDGFVVR